MCPPCSCLLPSGADSTNASCLLWLFRICSSQTFLFSLVPYRLANNHHDPMANIGSDYFGQIHLMCSNCTPNDACRAHGLLKRHWLLTAFPWAFSDLQRQHLANWNNEKGDKCANLSPYLWRQRDAKKCQLVLLSNKIQMLSTLLSKATCEPKISGSIWLLTLRCINLIFFILPATD